MDSISKKKNRQNYNNLLQIWTFNVKEEKKNEMT